MRAAALQHKGSEAVTWAKWQSQDLGKDCLTSKASMCPTSPLRVVQRSPHGSHESGREKKLVRPHWHWVLPQGQVSQLAPALVPQE